MKPRMNSHETSPPPYAFFFIFPQHTSLRFDAPMANSRKSKAELKPDDERRRCKKHPKHRQSPGVCSLCLTEKLSHILSASATSSRKTSASLSSSSSSSLSSYYSSASSCSSCSSPLHRDLYRYGMDRKAPISSLFKKSRSLAFAPRIGGRVGDNGKKNGGFWSKLLGRPRRKEMEEALTHSRTMVQRVHG